MTTENQGWKAKHQTQAEVQLLPRWDHLERKAGEVLGTAKQKMTRVRHAGKMRP